MKLNNFEIMIRIFFIAWSCMISFFVNPRPYKEDAKLVLRKDLQRISTAFFEPEMRCLTYPGRDAHFAFRLSKSRKKSVLDQKRGLSPPKLQIFDFYKLLKV